MDDRPAAVELTWFGLVYRPSERRTVVVSVNVGGAIVPTAVSVHLVVDRGIALQAVVAIAVVTAVVFIMGRPLDGVGIVGPMLLPPLAAAVTAIVVGGPAVAALAYAAGTLGTLVGAGILHPAPSPRPWRLAAQLPAAALADLVNLHPTTAVKWMHQAGGDWTCFAAELARTCEHQSCRMPLNQP